MEQSFVSRVSEYKDLLESLAQSSPGPAAKALAARIVAMFKEDQKFARSRQRVEALPRHEQEALDCICEYWAQDRIRLNRSHTSWVARAYSLLDYFGYYETHYPQPE